MLIKLRYQFTVANDKITNLEQKIKLKKFSEYFFTERPFTEYVNSGKFFIFVILLYAIKTLGTKNVFLTIRRNCCLCLAMVF